MGMSEASPFAKSIASGLKSTVHLRAIKDWNPGGGDGV